MTRYSLSLLFSACIMLGMGLPSPMCEIITQSDSNPQATNGMEISQDLIVSTDAQLHKVMKNLTAGMHIQITPGVYTRGIFISRTAGTAKNPIQISGSDPEHPPVFIGKGEGA